MQVLSLFMMVLVNFNLLANGVKLERFQQEICVSKNAQILFYDKLVYSIKKTEKSITYNPLGTIGNERFERGEIWQSVAPSIRDSSKQYFIESGYGLLKHKTGLYLVQGQTAAIPKNKCKFSHDKSHFEPWNCLVRLKDPTSKTFLVKIKANRKIIDVNIDEKRHRYKNPGLFKAGITAKGDSSAIIWFNAENVFITIGSLSKFNQCRKAQNNDYPFYITNQITGGDES